MFKPQTMLRLGLDVGTNSIGWAITACLPEEYTNTDTGEFRYKAGLALETLGMGSHIFPVGVAEDKFAKNSTEESKNIKRRTMRMARRLNNRYKQRRARLHRLLLENNMMPEPGWQHITPPQLWALRARALDERVDPTELGRILLHLNQRRGFKSTRSDDAKAGSGDKETGAVKEGMAETERTLAAAGARTLGEYGHLLFKQAGESGHHNPYEALDEQGHTIRRRFVRRSLYEKEV